MKKQNLLKSVPFISLILILSMKFISNRWIQNNYLTIVITLLLCSLTSFLLLKFPKEFHKKLIFGVSIVVTAIILFIQIS